MSHVGEVNHTAQFPFLFAGFEAFRLQLKIFAPSSILPLQDKSGRLEVAKSPNGQVGRKRREQGSVIKPPLLPFLLLGDKENKRKMQSGHCDNC